jgi:hypothetical protein
MVRWTEGKSDERKRVKIATFNVNNVNSGFPICLLG